jgi:hypothetical protein
MAPRSSLYSSALQIPEWVYGGEFGDLSKVMNARDIDYERVAQSEQQTEENEINLEAKRRKERMRDILNERAGQSRPATIREAYEQMINAAYESGDPVAAMELESKKQNYEQAQLNNRRAEVTGAIGLAEKGPYGVLKTVYGDNVPISEEDANAIYNRRGRSSSDGRTSERKEKYVEVYDTEDNIIRNVPESEAEAGQIDGRMIRTDDPRLLQNMPLTGKPGKAGKNNAKDSADDSGFKIFRDPSLTAAPQNGRGDRARNGPSVGDQVDTIIRKRTVG